jgi:hypothetical protein
MIIVSTTSLIDIENAAPCYVNIEMLHYPDPDPKPGIKYLVVSFVIKSSPGQTGELCKNRPEISTLAQKY